MTFVGLSLIFTILSWIAFAGWVSWVNFVYGEQEPYHLQGSVVALDYPKSKKIANKYAIEIARTLEGDTLVLSVPVNSYRVGDEIDLEMKMGSLGLLYRYE